MGIALSLAALSSCSSSISEPDYIGGNNSQNILESDGAVPTRKELAQNWSDAVRSGFWWTSQGSRIMPYNWFAWLEQPGNEQLFRNTEHMEMLRYLPESASEANPAGLPIGFAKDIDKKTGQSYVGMTCSACHTTQIDYGETKLLVEGAPTIANFVLFVERLVAALNETYQNDAKFERFAKNVLGADYDSARAKTLREQLGEVALATTQRQKVNALPADYPKDFTSYARLDAFGNIQNAGTAFALHDLANSNPPTAPVSYPFLWGTHQSNVVQWNASAPNRVKGNTAETLLGPLSRNVGEVIGVFGGLEMEEAPWWAFKFDVQYRSSVHFAGLGKLESWVKTLNSPQWPSEILPKPDQNKAAAGSILYAENCASCHQVVPRADEFKNYTAHQSLVSEIGTDPATTYNATCHKAKTLLLEGTKEGILFGDVFAENAAAIEIPVNGALGLILENPDKAIRAALKPMLTDPNKAKQTSAVATSMANAQKALKNAGDVKQGFVTQQVIQYAKNRDKATKSAATTPDCFTDPGSLDGLVYKGRPLNGIWATAPYLHNGSVPNLWQLLQAPEQRVTTFKVGSRQFDPVNVGYVTDEGLSTFNVNKANGEVMLGNGNGGHVYGTDLNDEQKWQLVEYMKTL